ncbi:MAG TPA: hypothetical protein VGI33_07285 [Paenibacillus sp.]|jgi:hypothetical protein
MLSGHPLEDQLGHVHWAAHQEIPRIQNEIQDQVTEIKSKVNDASKDQIDQIFAYMKQARLILTSGTTEPFEGHLNWAKNQNVDSVLNEIQNEGNIILDNNKYKDLDLFPITATQHSSLGDHRNMETTVTISKNGRVDGLTHTETGNRLQGYHGYVKVYLQDAARNNVWVSQQEHRYGVDGVVAGKPSRNDTWDETIPLDKLDEIDLCVIYHSTTKVDISADEAQKWAKVLEPAAKALAN